MHDNRHLLELIEKYRQGKCTEAEYREFNDWYASFDAQPGLEEILGEEERIALGEHLLAAVRKNISTEKRGTGSYMTLLRKKITRQWYKAAAVLLLGVGLTYFFYTRSVSPNINAPVTFSRVTTGPGEMQKVVLPDSSTAWLNAKSSIRYAKGFASKTRDVYLTGEAFFEVAHDAGKPFIVHSGELQTKVLGTSFNVNAYGDDGEMSITVMAGKVKVGLGEINTEILTANQQVTFDVKHRMMKRGDSMNVALAGAWRSGWLIFHDESFEVIVDRLQRKFDVLISLESPALGHCRLTASFAPETGLMRILDLLCKANKSHYQVNKKTGAIIITGTGCKPSA